jgi:altronate dehydratase small subunit
MYSQREFVIMEENDNVGIIKQPVSKGQRIGPVGKGGKAFVEIKEDIPFGFKFAIRDIQKGEEIVKFSEAIGVASVPIAKGEMVHVHNIEGLRGRGDLEKGAKK